MASVPSIEEWKEAHEENLTIIPDCLCPNCNGSKAVTTMLPTKVPFFREIIVMNLTCEECYFRNSEVSFGGTIQERGERLTLTVSSPDDLNRQIIKSDSATLLVPRLELEIPPTTQKGSVSTIEGFFKKTASNLEELQPERLRLGDVDNFHRCRRVIEELRRMAGGLPVAEDDEEADDEGAERDAMFPFEIVLDDPAGNSFIENPFAPMPDPDMKSEHYWRTPTQDMSLGLQPSQVAIEEGTIDDSKPQHKNVVNAAKGSHAIEKLSSRKDGDNVGREEVIKFTTTCPHCYKPTETSMCVTDIPHFKEVIIMSMICELCGFRSNEIKGGGAIPRYGSRITLSVRGPDDLGREVLKSDTGGLIIPEIDLELDEGGLDGVYTTVEGLLKKLKERLELVNPFGRGDSATKQHRNNDGGQFSSMSPSHDRYLKFLEKLNDMAEGKTFPFTIILSDPLSNSFVGPIPSDAVALALQAEKEGNNKCYETYVDDGMVLEEYERSYEQNEILGLNDIKTENYQQDGHIEYFGTDAPQEVPDRIRRLDIRGPDHPHQVGKAPVDGDTTVMGAGSLNFAVPAMAQRGKLTNLNEQNRYTLSLEGGEIDIQKLLRDFEYNDERFIMNDEYDGHREGKVFKDGAQGMGYYTNKPLLQLWEEYQSKQSKA